VRETLWPSLNRQWYKGRECPQDLRRWPHSKSDLPSIGGGPIDHMDTPCERVDP
jgi:hypothetical protein